MENLENQAYPPLLSAWSENRAGSVIDALLLVVLAGVLELCGS